VEWRLRRRRGSCSPSGRRRRRVLVRFRAPRRRKKEESPIWRREKNADDCERMERDVRRGVPLARLLTGRREKVPRANAERVRQARSRSHVGEYPPGDEGEGDVKRGEGAFALTFFSRRTPFSSGRVGTKIRKSHKWYLPFEGLLASDRKTAEALRAWAHSRRGDVDDAVRGRRPPAARN